MFQAAMFVAASGLEAHGRPGVGERYKTFENWSLFDHWSLVLGH
jgi:hypothetical protein